MQIAKQSILGIYIFGRQGRIQRTFFFGGGGPSLGGGGLPTPIFKFLHGFRPLYFEIAEFCIIFYIVKFLNLSFWGPNSPL